MKKPNKPNSGSRKNDAESAPLTPAAASNPASVKVNVKEIGTEPTARRNPLPVLLIALLGLGLFWANMYVVQYGGQLDARVHAPYVNWSQIEGTKPPDKGGEEIRMGQTIYVQYCSSCHMGDGNGNASGGFPPLAGSEWVLVKDPARIIRIILNGLGGPIMVKGKQYGQVQMLPWRDALNDQQVAAVATYIRNSWGNKAERVDPALVQKIRDETKDRGGAWTADELLAIPLKD